MLGRITAGLFFLLLVWGNLVAGLKAGLACPDWPLCQGRMLPPFRLDIWMEFGHRLLAAAAGVTLLVLAWKRFGTYRGAARGVPLAAVSLLAVEVMLGGAVVLLELPVQLTTVHFMTGLTIFLLVTYMAIFDGTAVQPRFSLRGHAGVFFGMAAVLFFQAALGAYVRHSDAGLACTDFPTCGGSLLPAGLAGTLLTHYSHRLAAFLIFLTTGVIAIAGYLDPGLAGSRRQLAALAALSLVQIGVGALVVLSGLNFMAVALHLATAMAMLVVTARIWSRAIRFQD